MLTTTESGITLPTLTKDAIDRYHQHKLMPGSFVQAVLENDLRRAIENGDEDNLKHLKGIVTYVQWECDGLCWGNAERVRYWIHSRYGDQG